MAFERKAHQAFIQAGTVLLAKMPLSNTAMKAFTSLDPEIRGTTTSMLFMNKFLEVLPGLQEKEDVFKEEVKMFQHDKSLKQIHVTRIDEWWRQVETADSGNAAPVKVLGSVDAIQVETAGSGNAAEVNILGSGDAAEVNLPPKEKPKPKKQLLSNAEKCKAFRERLKLDEERNKLAKEKKKLDNLSYRLSLISELKEIAKQKAALQCSRHIELRDS
ncbi:hypothetical protein PoB_006294300 [Plakobranchus ocellatus]|uniref:BZIP domain-containing protein n=1 Tax=Plakobranchus ocellatus TaxID=259542 RepID=A0AAV4CX21_9GAST|nr:hypothetical protein PoB_006294300 [Plakobranchus ocellatus]